MRKRRIEKDPFDTAGETVGSEHRIDIAVVRLDDRETIVNECLFDSVGISVDSDDPDVGVAVKKRTAVASPTECRIDDPPVCGRLEPCHGFVDHHRDVIGTLM